MLASFPVAVLVGSILGFLAGLGVGGGSILVLWLTVMLRVDPQIARGINLLFFLPCSIIVCLFRWKQGDIPWKQILPGIICGCLASGIFSMISTWIQIDMLKKLFGILLVFAGLRELFYKAK